MFVFSLFLTAAAIRRLDSHENATETETPTETPPEPAAAACETLLGTMTAVMTAAATNSTPALPAECLGCIATKESEAGMALCAPAPEGATCSEEEAMGLLAGIMAQEGGAEGGSRKLQALLRKLDAHESGGDDDDSAAMMAALSQLTPACGDCFLAGFMSMPDDEERRLAGHEGGDPMLAMFSHCTGMATGDLMAAAQAAGVLPEGPSTEGCGEDYGTPEVCEDNVGPFLEYVATTSMASMMSADTDCAALIAAMVGYNVDCDGDLSGVFGMLNIDTTGTIVECTKPKTFCCATCSPTTTTTTTTVTTTTAAPAPGADDSESAAAVTGLAALLLAYFA